MQFIVLAASVLLSVVAALASTTLLLRVILRVMSKLR